MPDAQTGNARHWRETGEICLGLSKAPSTPAVVHHVYVVDPIPVLRLEVQPMEVDANPIKLVACPKQA